MRSGYRQPRKGSAPKSRPGPKKSAGHVKINGNREEVNFPVVPCDWKRKGRMAGKLGDVESGAEVREEAAQAHLPLSSLANSQIQARLPRPAPRPTTWPSRYTRVRPCHPCVFSRDDPALHTSRAGHDEAWSRLAARNPPRYPPSSPSSVSLHLPLCPACRCSDQRSRPGAVWGGGVVGSDVGVVGWWVEVVGWCGGNCAVVGWWGGGVVMWWCGGLVAGGWEVGGGRRWSADPFLPSGVP